MSWDDRLAKGRIGERIIDEWLIRKGFVPYRPVDGVPHPFDRLVASQDKRKILIVEVKSKPRREKYPDTGIPARHYRDYQHIALTYGIRIFIAFVDEIEQKIYGNFFEELDRRDGRYPWIFPDIVYFPLTHMRPVADLTTEQCAELKALRKTKYQQEW